MFHYDAGLFLTSAQLGVDVRRRQPRCFVSHAHADHIARHELALATRVTAQLYRHRMGPRHRVLEMLFREPITFARLQLTAYPAGHCFGSAMLLADDGENTLLYTGDFKLDASATAESAELPRADILVMESTFGLPRYRMPPRDEVINELLTIVRAAIRDGKTPVIHAYPLGKSQEITRILTSNGVPVLQHPCIFEISRIYQACGADLGDFDVCRGDVPAGCAVITLPRGMHGFRVAGMRSVVTITATGWAVDRGTRYRLGVDHALPLSDHADFDQLIDAVHRVAPREVYCTHGPHEFVGHLRDRGFNAFSLHPPKQRCLF
jgi:putative mRNA 3-end processing factor